MINNWVVNAIADLAEVGKLRSLARMGFIDRGRGAIWLNLTDGEQGLSCLSRAAWECFELDEPRRIAVFNAIDTYEPLTQAVVVAFSNVDSKHEVTTCVVNSCPRFMSRKAV
jgi:hypothetical protein